MKVLIAMGTRPEAIKMAPVVARLRADARFEPFVLATGQHRRMLDQVLDWFHIVPDRDLEVMRENQGLSDLASRMIGLADEVIAANPPDAVLVQGDTTSAFCIALAAFHRRVPVGHVEAGLRTYDLTAPFPEEANRSLIGRIARWHFAPTERARTALERENVPGEIHLTGNTVVDALDDTARRAGVPPVPLTRPRLVLITGHRRENFGPRFEAAFAAIADLARSHADIDFVYPVHLNPQVQAPARTLLAGLDNVQLIDPVSYPDMIALLKRAELVITDSGGVQEEAPSFGVPIVIMRDTTERQEVVDAGIGFLAGADRARIVELASEFLDDPARRSTIKAIPSPFGDGRAAARIADILHRSWAESAG